MTDMRNPASLRGIVKMSAKTARTAIIIGYEMVPKTGANYAGQELAPNKYDTLISATFCVTFKGKVLTVLMGEEI
jgi:hypothetical protein